MHLDIRAAAGVSADVAELARTRLVNALKRFAPRVRSLTVRLTDLNGPRGGVDKKCLVAIRLRSPRRTIVLEDTAADAAVAVARIADRAGRAVARAVDALTRTRTAQPAY